jgi:hypothetical protein
VDTRSRVEAAGLAHEKQDAGKKGVTMATNSFYTAVVGRDWGGGGSGWHVHVVKGRRAGGGLVNDRGPGAMAMGGMAMTQRWQVRLRAWEQGNPKREGTDG